jgi:hypothetical protein
MGNLGCCARAASGHAAVPPSAASNSRRPMVTVIRPSRARCVKGTIPRHERAVLPFKEGSMLVAFTFVVGFGQRPASTSTPYRTGEAAHLYDLSDHYALHSAQRV